MFKFNKFVNNLEKYICFATFAIMLILVFVNVLSRFVFHMSLSFTEEIVTSLFVLASLCGTSLAIRNGTHLGLDYFTSFMPKRVQWWLTVAGNVLGIILVGLFLVYGIDMVANEYSAKQLSPTMAWPEWIYGLCVPVGSAFLLFRYIFALYLMAKGYSGVATELEDVYE